MASSLRIALSASAVLAAALLVTGCVSSPGAPTSTSEPAPTSAPDQSEAPALPDPSPDDMEATWLDNGRMFAVVTWGSSTCLPTADTVTANGQTVTVKLSESDGDGDDDALACTSDLAPRASLGVLPEGVDPTKDVELIVTLGDVTDDIDLDGNPSFTSHAESNEPSAGWFDDDSLVLLTWGSSMCLPVVEDVQASGQTGTVTFATEDRVCTMDMVPRATIISFPDLIDDADDDDAGDDDAFTLTLVGGNLDGTVTVIED